MVVNGIFKFCGVESFSGKDKSKVYHNIILMQGWNVEKVFANSEELIMVANIKPDSFVNVEFDIVDGSNSKVYKNVVSISASNEVK